MSIFINRNIFTRQDSTIHNKNEAHILIIKKTDVNSISYGLHHPITNHVNCYLLIQFQSVEFLSYLFKQIKK